jgi:hypothetical protein
MNIISQWTSDPQTLASVTYNDSPVYLNEPATHKHWPQSLTMIPQYISMNQWLTNIGLSHLQWFPSIPFPVGSINGKTDTSKSHMSYLKVSYPCVAELVLVFPCQCFIDRQTDRRTDSVPLYSEACPGFSLSVFYGQTDRETDRQTDRKMSHDISNSSLPLYGWACLGFSLSVFYGHTDRHGISLGALFSLGQNIVWQKITFSWEFPNNL